MKILGIETSCDETSAAVYETSGRWRGALLSNIVASQVDLHAKFGGVVPELSARAHVERLPLIVEESLSAARCGFQDVDAIAVTARPGLLSALLCGVSYAKGLSIGLRRPLYAVDHVKAHVAAAFLDPPAMEGRAELAPNVTGSPAALSVENLPALALVASGGHTLLLKMTTPVSFELLGGTRDDAVGEAFDKVGQLLCLPFPGGPHVERAASGGNPAAFRFPVGVIRDSPLDFSFSGLKTAVLYTMNKMPAKEKENRKADLAASFQAAAIRALVDRALAAVRQTDIRTFILCGGVAANRALRETLSNALAAADVRFHVPPVIFCGDTAAQVAVFASHLIAANVPPASAGLDAATTSEVFETSG